LRSDVFPRAYVLSIGNTGERGASAKGNEIWAKVIGSDGKPTRPIVPIPDGWVLKDDGTVSSTAGGGDAISWRVPLERGKVLVMTRHEWSGIAQVDWLGNKQRIDLFSAGEPSSERIALSGRPAPTRFDHVVSIVVAAGASLTISLLLFLLVLQFCVPARAERE